MKKFLIIALYTFLVLSATAQVPAYIPYQAIARDAAGHAKTNTPIQVEFKIFNTMVSATPAYDETHSLTTNDFGYFNLRIGAGVVQSGTFSAITWQTGDVSYEIWIDMGLGFSQLGGRTGFLSVPYALYAANTAPNPTITINAPNTISSPSTAVYNIQVPASTLSINGSSLSVSNGNMVTLPTPTITSSGVSVVTPTTGNTFNIDVPAPALNYNSATNELSITQGTAVSTQTLSSAGAVRITGMGMASVSPTVGTTFTVSVPIPSLSVSNGSLSITNGNAVALPTQSLEISSNSLTITNGNTVILPSASITGVGTGAASVTTSANSFTVSVPNPSLSVSNGSMSITNGNTVTLPTQSLSINSNSLSISGGNTVVVPTTTVVSANSNMTVTNAAGVYSLTVVTPTLSVTGGVLSGAYPNQTLTIPTSSTTAITGSTNINVQGTAPNYTISSVTPTLNVTGGVLSGMYPNQTLTIPTSSTTTITGSANINVQGTAPNYTISSVTPTLTATGNATIGGSYPSQTISVAAQTLSISGNTLSLSAGGGSVSLPPSWGLAGNAGASATTNFIGTTDLNDLVTRTNNVERLRVTSTGSVGIGTSSPAAGFDVNAGNVKLGAGSTPFSIVKYGALSGSLLLSIGNNAGTLSIPGAQAGDIVVVTLNSHNASPGSISLNNAYISASNTLSYNINSSLGLLVTLNFSYILMRP